MKELIIKGHPVHLAAFKDDVNLSPALAFMEKWQGNDTSFTFYSSGSTGRPKAIRLSRKFLNDSALRTIEYFDIRPSDTLLLALDTSFMGGIMMIVRALVAKCNLLYCPPQALRPELVSALPPVALASLVPSQLEKLFSQNASAATFTPVKHLLLGGASLSSESLGRLMQLGSSCRFYHSYGMTETASHVAIKKISLEDEQVYHALKGFSFSVDNQHCLQIHYSEEPSFSLSTKDMVNLLSPFAFEWIGRADWVVNSGGVKFNLETAENEVRSFLAQQQCNNEFTSYKAKDDIWGEKWVLIVEGELSQQTLALLKVHCKQTLGKYVYPKDVLFIPELMMLSSGKIDRQKTYEKALTLLS